ncbi:hypothetical protein MYX78_00525 [Acidobacteria bacterium AH-259-G07]|nr:hypothetical protein [Acidobacteria bacterium AH-259-G07]
MGKADLTDMLLGSKSNSELGQAQSVAPRNSEKKPLLWIAVSVVALLLGATLIYFINDLSRQQALQLQAFQTHTEQMSQALQLIERRLDGDADQIADLASQIQVTMGRVGVTQRELARARVLAQQLKKEQQQNVATLSKEIQQKANAEKVAQLEQQSTRKFEGVDREISGVKEDVKSTRQELLDTVAELSDLGVKVNGQGQMIATNLAGVEELRRRGERDYVTFDLKKKVKTRVAGITLELRDTDGDPRDADIHIYANDTRMERQDVPQNVPVNLYVGTERIPYELVFNEIFHKPDMVTGYISIPKGKLSEGSPQLSGTN